MAATIKLGYEAGVSTPELAFYRFAFGLPPLLGWIWWSGNAGAWRTQRPAAHAWRALVGLSTMLLAFGSLAYLPLAESTTIGFAAPLFAVMLSALVLKEKVGPHRWGAVIAGFLGVLLVMRPEGRDLPALGLGLAVAAAFGVGVVTITIRQIGRTEHPQTTVLADALLRRRPRGAHLADPRRARHVRGLRPALPHRFAALRARLGGGAVRLYPAALGGPAGLADLLEPAARDHLARRRRDHRQRPLHPLPRA
jgi:hypothetical protein